MDVEIIADGVHLPGPLLKLLYKKQRPRPFCINYRCYAGCGMPEGDSIPGNIQNGLKVIVEDGVAKLPGRSSFAGSVVTADRLVRTMIKMADVPFIDAVRMITSTRARIMKVSDKKGALVAGKDADIVVFDKEINIKMTVVKGRTIYEKP